MNGEGLRQRRKVPQVVEEDKEVSGYGPSAETKKSWNVFGLILTSLVLVLALGYVASPIDPVQVEGVELVGLSGKFALNEDLTRGKRIHNLLGAESIVELEESGVLITGLLDGSIKKIYPSEEGKIGEGKVETLVKIEGGRPLGLRRKGQRLFVADAIKGLYTVDIESGQLETLVDAKQHGIAFVNDLTISEDGQTIYFTETSTDFPLSQIFYAYISGRCNGRVWKYEKGSLGVVVDQLCAANGIEMSNNHLLVAEGSAFRITFVDADTFVKTKSVHLPFAPDNIRTGSEGSYLVAGSHLMTPAGLILMQSLTTVKRIVAGLWSHDALYNFFTRVAVSAHNLVVEMDGEGKVVRTLHDQGARLTSELSQATLLSDGRFALGSYSSNFIVLLDTDDDDRS